MKILGGCVGGVLSASRHLYYNTYPNPIEIFWGVGVSFWAVALSTILLYHRYKKYEFFVVVGVEKTSG